MGTLTKWLDPSVWLDALVPGRGMSLSNPNSRAPEADFWYQSTFGIPSLAGIIGGNNAWQFVSTSAAAMRLLCGVGSEMPLELKRATKANGRRTTNVMELDPRHQLLNQKSNPVMVSQAFRSLMIAWQIGHGTAFAEIVRDLGTNKAGRLWPIHPTRATPVTDKDTGELWWRVGNSGAEPTYIPDVDMLRVPYTLMDDDNIHGLGIGKLAARSIGLGQTLERTEQSASSSALPRIVVEIDKRMQQPEKDDFRRQWSEWQAGGDNVPVLLVDGAKAKPLQWSATDQDHRQRREFNQKDLAGWFGVSQKLLDGSEDMTLLFQKISLHYLSMWEQTCNDKLLTQDERNAGMYWQNDYRSLLKTDPVARSTYWTNRFSVGSATPNQVREAEGENPSSTENADAEHIQGAMRKLSDPYKPDAEKPMGNPKDGKAPPLAPKKSPSKGANAIRAARSAVSIMLSDTMGRMASKEMKRAKCDAGNPRTFIPKIEEFYGEHAKHLAEAIGPACQAANAVGWMLNPSKSATAWCDESKRCLLVSSECPAGELSSSVEAAVSDWNAGRVTAFVETLKPERKAVPC